MFSFLSEKSKYLEGEVSLKGTFMTSKRWLVLYSDLVAFYKTQSDVKPALLIPRECLVSSIIPAGKDTQIDLTFCGKSDTFTQPILLSTPQQTKEWAQKLTKYIEPPALRARKQLAYRGLLTGSFWSDVVGIAMANRDMTAQAGPRVRHIIMQGPLKKKSPKSVLGRRAWQTRIFVLHEDSLVYYKAKDEPPAGAVLLKDIASVTLSTEDDTRLDIIIRATTGSGTNNNVSNDGNETSTTNNGNNGEGDPNTERIMSLVGSTADEIKLWYTKIDKVRTYIQNKEKERAKQLAQESGEDGGNGDSALTSADSISAGVEGVEQKRNSDLNSSEGSDPSMGSNNHAKSNNIDVDEKENIAGIDGTNVTTSTMVPSSTTFDNDYDYDDDEDPPPPPDDSPPMSPAMHPSSPPDSSLSLGLITAISNVSALSTDSSVPPPPTPESPPMSAEATLTSSTTTTLPNPTSVTSTTPTITNNAPLISAVSTSTTGFSSPASVNKSRSPSISRRASGLPPAIPLPPVPPTSTSLDIAPTTSPTDITNDTNNSAISGLSITTTPTSSDSSSLPSNQTASSSISSSSVGSSSSGQGAPPPLPPPLDDDDLDDLPTPPPIPTTTITATTATPATTTTTSCSAPIVGTNVKPENDHDTKNNADDEGQPDDTNVVAEDDDDDDDDDDEEEGSSTRLSLRGLVSKKKRRFIKDGFDLDLTYITPNIIAMGFPSEGLEAAYRNKMSDVQRFLKKYHSNNYKVYNLCSEKSYSADKFDGNLARYPFDDHHPCPVRMLAAICEDAYSFIKRDSRNVVAVHCKAGKGRTGLVVCALLMHMRHDQASTFKSALEFYAEKRTINKKGVTIPSQQRWVEYYYDYLQRYVFPPSHLENPHQQQQHQQQQYHQYASIEGGPSFPATDPTLYFVGYDLFPKADFDPGGGCDPYVIVKTMNRYGYTTHIDPTKSSSSTGNSTSDKHVGNLLSKGGEIFRGWNNSKVLSTHSHWMGPDVFSQRFPGISVTGEFNLVFMDHDDIGNDDKMFACWFQTSFILNSHNSAASLSNSSVPDATSDVTASASTGSASSSSASTLIRLVLTKSQLDGAVGDKKCKHFPPNFTCTLYFDTNPKAPVPPLASTSSHQRQQQQQQQQQSNEQQTGRGRSLTASATRSTHDPSDSSDKVLPFFNRAATLPHTSHIQHETKDVTGNLGDIDDDDDDMGDDDIDDDNFIDDDDGETGSSSGVTTGESAESVSHNSAVSNTGNSDKPKWSVSNMVRIAVSKKKRRFQQDGFDLDLTYIRPNIIAMGFPSEGLEAAYRNKMSDVQKFLKKYHAGHYKVYNLCIEKHKEYPADRFELCARYPFKDHNPCSLLTLYRFCTDASTFLSRDPKNTVVIHCKAGKGRTGLMIACLLLHTQISNTAADALLYYGKKRTSNRKGVTIPSQQRFVWYYEHFLKNFYYSNLLTSFPFTGIPIVITGILLKPRADFDRGGGCDPYIIVTDLNDSELYHQKKAMKKIAKWKPDITEHRLDIRFRAQGEFKLNFYDHDDIGADDDMFHCWLSTTFFPANQKSVVLSKAELDAAVADKDCKHFPKDFAVEIFFEKAE